MDLGHQQDSDTQEPVFYPFPHSHWFTRPIAFRAYNSSGEQPQQDAGPRGARRFHIQISRPFTVRSTKEIVDSYEIRNPSFEYSERCIPKRYLTVPSVGVCNNGSDNENPDLIRYFGGILADDDNTRRRKEILIIMIPSMIQTRTLWISLLYLRVDLWFLHQYFC
ncbi:hypothetical protein M758_UG049100 [Ceratodon purpureus]|nr:hypothetical protein M758_UG049100 [Ceratodon purpureus]